MPHESRILMRPNETLLDICLETHMSTTGSSEPLSKEELSRNINILTTAVDKWLVNGGVRWRRFDDAVLELCKATLAEVDD